MRTMDVNGMWKSCAYREGMSEQELLAVPIDPPDEDEAVHGTGEEAEDEADDEADEDSDEDEGTADSELLGAVRPLVARVFAQFRDALDVLLQRHPGAPVTEEIGAQVFLSGLARQVLNLVAPTLFAELNAAHANGTLRGNTVDARFHNFLDDLDDESRARTLLREYPALGQLLRAVMTARADARLECVRHLCEDWPAIQQCWPALAGTRLSGVAAAHGAPQCGGRTALVLDFESAGLLVYRPRSIAVDVHFQELLEWFNARGANPAFRTVRMLDCGDRGWVEAVAPAACPPGGPSVRCHERLGGLMALLRVLQVADLPDGHLVLHGEHPVLIDAEALFQSQSRHRPGAVRSVEGAAGGQLAEEGLAQSILRVGLLARTGPCDVPEAMALTPLMPLSDVAAAERGFTRMYRLLCALRPQLLKGDGPLWRFASDRIQVLLRPSTFYAALLIESTSPDVLREGVERDRFFDRLWVDVDGEPELARVIHAERDDLEHGDVPCFTSTPASHAIWTSSGMELPGFYDRSALNEVEANLGRLGDDDLERQRWLLRVSLAAGSSLGSRAVVSESGPITMDADDGPKRRAPIGPLMAAPLDPEEYVDAAVRVARRLERLAFIDTVRASWVGVIAPHLGTSRDCELPLDDGTAAGGDGVARRVGWSIAPLGLSLGDGMSGVALFLARLASVTEEPRHRLLAEQAAVGVLELIASRVEQASNGERASVNAEWTSIGAFAGWGGVIYALAHLGVLLESGDYVERAEALVPLVERLLDRDEALDLNAGAAGAIMGLAALHAVRPSDRVLSVIVGCVSRLLVRAERLPIGYGWCASRAPARPPLTGFPEGAAGIALALLTASELTNDPAAHDIAHHAIEYERSALAPLTPLTMTWCRGASGIGLARLAGLRYLDYWRVRTEITDAVKATVRGGFGGNHCLCHGDLGNLEFLTVAAARFGDVPLRRDVAQIAAGVMRGIDERGWRCGTPGELETPGYLTGLAGIGDGLLRVAESRLPSVLMLEAPASPAVRAPRGRPQSPDRGGAVKRAMWEEVPVPVVLPRA